MDVTLQPDIETHLENSNQVILQALKANGGVLNISDKSSPEDIYASVHMSKKIFKKSIGNLYRQRKIKLEPGQISLLE